MDAYIILHCNGHKGLTLGDTFVVTFQCSKISCPSSESKQDETKLDISNT